MRRFLESPRVMPWRGQRGVVLLLVLVLMMSLAAVGLYVRSRALNGFYRSVQLENRVRATYLAEAGLHVGLQKLGGMSLTGIDLPYSLVEETLLGEGSFRAEMLNNPEDSGGAADTDGRVIIRSTGVNANGNQQRRLDTVVTVSGVAFPPLPGVITFGEDTQGTFTGNVSVNGYDGQNSVAGIAYEVPDQKSIVKGSPSVVGDPDYEWASSAFTTGEGFTAEAQWFIDRLATSSSAVHLTGAKGSRPGLGTASHPQATVVDANASVVLSGGDGYGILVVLGKLSITGGFNYHGLILVDGDATFEKIGGNAKIDGGVVLTTPTGGEPQPALRLNGTCQLNYSVSALSFTNGLVIAPSVRSYLLQN